MMGTEEAGHPSIFWPAHAGMVWVFVGQVEGCARGKHTSTVLLVWENERRRPWEAHECWLARLGKQKKTYASWSFGQMDARARAIRTSVEALVSANGAQTFGHASFETLVSTNSSQCYDNDVDVSHASQCLALRVS